LGAAWYLPEERQIYTKEQLLHEVCAALGGRVAEDVIFGRVSTGALNDLEKITKQAYAMIAVYGLNDKIGNVSFYDSTGQQEYSLQKPYSEKTAELIDQEVKKLIDEAYEKTKKILLENKESLTKIANILLEKEVIFKEDVEAILGKRKNDKEDNKSESKSTTEPQSSDNSSSTAHIHENGAEQVKNIPDTDSINLS
jgi:AFG3 family protein